MTPSAHNLWCEQYRPKDLNDYVFHDANHRDKILELIENKSIPHLLFSGVRGSGKTTLAQILIQAIEIDPMDVLTINASKERGIDTFRDKITSFASSMPMGNFKVIHLEEGDRLTPVAQDALKSFTEDNVQYVRFIITCNRPHMLTPELRSRFQEFHFKPTDKLEMLEYLVTILAKERVKFTLDQVEEYTDRYYPDTRKIVNSLQQNTIGRILHSVASSESDVSDYKARLLELIDKKQWQSARSLVISAVSSEQWEEFYQFLYDNLDKTTQFSKQDAWEQAIVEIAERLYRHTLVAVPHINAMACMINLSKI